ncbi:MAG: ATP-binding protein [Gemmataceae bacterium]|nr:ATP-binding protein [Gemmataceae bacterium]
MPPELNDLRFAPEVEHADADPSPVEEPARTPDVVVPEVEHVDADPPADAVLGRVEPDAPAATNEHVVVRVPPALRPRALRGGFVRIIDSLGGTKFLGRVVAGPFFPMTAENGDLLIRVEVHGEMTGERTHDTNDRPAPGSLVYDLSPAEVGDLMNCAGDMMLGTLAGCDGVLVGLESDSKDVLPRNVGIFGTVGSGKSNTAQVLIEEAAAHGWAVIVLDVEGEYVGMDAPGETPNLAAALAKFGRKPAGVPNFTVLHPASCASERPDSRPFTLRLADFEVPVVTELIQATMPERNALLDCVEHFQSRFWQRMATTEGERLSGLLDPLPTAPRPFTLQQLYDRARERAPRSNDLFDFLGLSTKLLTLIHAGAFDLSNMNGLDPAALLKPGRVTVIDVSVANDTVKNLATADLLRKVFALKIAKADTPPTVVVIEEAHSFISREKVHQMQATLTMLRNVTRRGRKRWLATAFVSQQPGHLPAEMFELCNTRLVHTLRSMHNLDALMATTSDVTGELWARCPLLGTGEAILSSPQLKRPAVVCMRPAASRRKFTR